MQEYVEQADKRAKERLASDLPDSEDQKTEIITDIGMHQQILQNRDDPRADEFIYDVGQEILGKAGLSVADSQVPYSAFAEFVRRGLLELDRRNLARLNDDHSEPFFDQQFNPVRAPDRTFGEIADQYLQLTKEDATANQTSQKWVNKQEASVQLLREIIVEGKPLRSVDYDECMRVRTVLAHLPGNRNKLYGGLTIDEAIARAEKVGKPLLSPVTQQVYLGTLAGILDLAVKKRIMSANPAQGLKPLKRDTVIASAKRRPFTPAQLQEIFGSDFYQECGKHTPPYKHDTTGWRFWLPLMCLFTGMRPNEACQLSAGDVKRTDQETWYFDIVASADEDDAPGPSKTLKTATSRRRIPIHPQLVKMGLLEFVETMGSESANSLLFPALKPDQFGDRASYALKRFRENFLPKMVNVEPRQSFYSFRHNFRDDLRRIDVAVDVHNITMEEFALPQSHGTTVRDYSTHSTIETIYLGKKNTNHTTIYNKSKQLKDVKSISINTPVVRVERCLIGQQLMLKAITQLKNPFSAMHISPCLPPAPNPNKTWEWTIFEDSVKVRGIKNALSLLPEDRQKVYRKHLKANQQEWWRPDTIWEKWPVYLS